MQPEQQQPKYQDVYDDTSFAEGTSSDKESSLSFPQQLMEVLSDERLSDVVSWLPHGQGWIIHDKKRFAVEVLPVYFEKKSKWTSFTRKLNRWNFTRVTRGDEVGAYYHPLFKRENKELCQQMTCLGSKMTQNLEPLNPVALGLATPKMIEHGLLSGMAPRGGFMKSTAKKKAAIPSQQQSMILPPSSSAAFAAPQLSPSLYFQSQLTASTSISHQLNPPPVHNFPNISVPSTTQATGYPDHQQQQVFLGGIGNPLTSSTYGGMALPELRNTPPWTNARRPPSPNPLPFGNDVTPFLQQTPVPSFSSWTQLPTTTTTEPLFASNHAAQPSFPAASSLQQSAQQVQHQNIMVAHTFDQFNQRSIHAGASQQEDTLTLTPTPALSHSSSIVETPSQQTSRHLAPLPPQQDSTAGGHEALSPDDHSGQDISPSIFDTTSSSSDQGSGVVHAGQPQGSSSSPEETGNKTKLTSRIMMPTVRTSGAAMPQQQQPGSRGDGGGGSSNIVRSLPGRSVVAMHQSQNNIVSGDQRPGGGVMSSLSSTQHASVVVGNSSNDRILASLLDQTRKDFHDLLQQQQQQQQQQGGEEPLIFPATMDTIVRGNQRQGGPFSPEGKQK